MNILCNPFFLLFVIGGLLFLLRVLLISTGLIYTTKKWWKSIEDRFHVYQLYKVPEFNESMQENQLYSKVSVYLNSLASMEDSDFTNLFTGKKSNEIILLLDSGQVIDDDFLGASVSWIKEVKTQAKIGVGLDLLWKALAKDLKFTIPDMIPNLVKDADVIEGDGGLGTVYLFNFGPEIKTMTYQKEKISELDESLHRIALEVIEGGHLNLGFSYYNTIFQLTATGEGETLIDVTVAYESETEDDALPSKTTSSTLAFIKNLENYLLKAAA